MSDVAPPDTTVWWDVDTVTAAALDILRLQATDVDADRVRGYVDVAGQAINNYIDAEAVVWPTLDPPAPIATAQVYAVVELYRTKDSPPATANDFTVVTGYVPADPLATVYPLLRPYRRRFGVG